MTGYITAIPGSTLSIILQLGANTYKDKHDNTIYLTHDMRMFLIFLVNVSDLDDETKAYYLNELERNDASDTSPPE